MTPHAIRVLARYAVRNVEALSEEQRIELYSAIAAALPPAQEKTEAERIAWMLSEAKKAQTSFIETLFKDQVGGEQ